MIDSVSRIRKEASIETGILSNSTYLSPNYLAEKFKINYLLVRVWHAFSNFLGTRSSTSNLSKKKKKKKFNRQQKRQDIYYKTNKTRGKYNHMKHITKIPWDLVLGNYIFTKFEKVVRNLCNFSSWWMNGLWVKHKLKIVNKIMPRLGFNKFV